MANRLPKQARAKVIKLVYEKADDICVYGMVTE